MALISGGGGGGSSAVLQVASAMLTAAQIQALNSAAIEVVAAPGTGKILVAAHGWGVFRAGATPYTNNASAKFVIGHIGSPLTEVDFLRNSAAGGILSNAGDQAFFLGPETNTAWSNSSFAWDDLALCENKSLVVALEGGGVGSAGDGTCLIAVAYYTAATT